MLPRRACSPLALLALLASSGCGPTEPGADASLQGCDNGRGACVEQVSLGGAFGCAALGDGTVWCWGRNDLGQLGYNTTGTCNEVLAGGQTQSVACHAFPFQVVSLAGATRVAAGESFACAAIPSEVRCWGANEAGQLGSTATLPSTTPLSVANVGTATSLAAGSRHVCAVAGGSLRCWGANERGQLGGSTPRDQCMAAEGPIPCSRSAVSLSSLTFEEVVAGSAHTCARTPERSVYCWGDNRWGQLGRGAATALPEATPQPVLFAGGLLTNVQSLSARGEQTCATTMDGAVLCWGRNDRAQLGVPAASTPMATGCDAACATSAVQVPGFGPTQVPGPPPASDAGMDGSRSDGGRADATAEAGPGPMDGGAPDARPEAGPSDGASAADARRDTGPALPLVRAVSVGEGFACVVLDDGTGRCWGANELAQVGNGRATMEPQGPGVVIASPGAAVNNPLQGLTRLGAGRATACAVLMDRSLRCWGSNQSGALGTGSTSSSAPSAPIPVSW